MTSKASSATRIISYTVIVVIIRLLDGLLLMLAGIISLTPVAFLTGTSSDLRYLPAIVLSSAATVVSLERAGAYSRDALQSLPLQIRLLARSIAVGLVCAVVCLSLLDVSGGLSRLWPVAWAIVAAMLMAAARLISCALIKRWATAGRLARRMAIVGAGDFSREFIARLGQEPAAYRILGIYDDRQTRIPPEVQGIAVMGSVDDLLQQSREQPIDVIVIALPLSAVDRISQILDQLSSCVSDICLTTDLAGLHYSSRQFTALGQNPVVSVRETPMKDWRAVSKAAFDYGLGMTMFLLLLPILALIALIIKADSNGPVLFRQPRMGFNNHLFLCYKFRSMRQDATDLLADRQVTRDDPRVTRVGKYLRKLSLDELPQLINVLNGTMSLVGPRPHAPNTKAADKLFTDVVRRYASRHRVKPGITGWAQMNGWRGETRTLDQIEGRVACDLDYIERWSVGLDLKILVMTILREIRSKHAF